jgi:crotonobetainyl-CoA:carnitine CoA-transferase CaiB-like acyl-CoA transferase
VPALADDERFASNSGRVAHREEVVSALQTEFARRPAAYWVSRCDDFGVPASLVRTLDQVFASTEGAATVHEVADPARGPLRYVKTPIWMSGTPLREPSPPPLLGQHRAQVLAALRAAQQSRADVVDEPRR